VEEGRLVEDGSSIFQIMGAKEADRTVGTNPVGVVLSEYSTAHVNYEKTWNYIRPILTENKGFAMFPYTARGMNHGYRLYTVNKDNPAWHVEYHTSDSARHNGLRVLTEEMIQEERRSGMSEELIQQEFYNDWSSGSQAAYYSKYMKDAEEEGRIDQLPYDPTIPVSTAWDIGHTDATAIWFYQAMGDGWINFIDYYEMTKEDLPHFVKVLKQKPYNYGYHFFPHDMKVTERGAGKTRAETAWGLGIKPTIVKKTSIEEGIEAVRVLLPRARFDKEKCDKGIEALKHYSKQDTGLTDMDGKPIYSSKPIPKQAEGHASDAMRYAAQVIDMIPTMSYDSDIIELNISVDTEYDMFNF